MGIAVTAQTKIVDLLIVGPSPVPSPSPSWYDTYSQHATADMEIPSFSVETVLDEPILGDAAIDANEMVDNRLIQIMVRVHTGWRLGPHNTILARTITDEIVTLLRQHVNLGEGYWLFQVGVRFGVSHDTSGTTGAEILINIHKVAFYAQS